MSTYSPRGFMRQVSNDLLREYFEQRSIGVDVAWDELEETSIEPLWNAWSGMSVAEQRMADADFADVNGLANEAGISVLIEEGRWRSLDLAATFAAMDDQTDMVMWTFLKHPDVFRVAALFLTADSIPSRSWHKWKSLPQTPPADDRLNCDALSDSLKRYFVETQGRGRHCKVEVYQRSGRFYYFAFPEDYARAEQDFDENGDLKRQTHRPAFQLVFVYSLQAGTLDATAPGGKPVVEKLMELALMALLGIEHRDNQKDDRVYDFDRLRDPNFAWQYPPEAGIARVWVKALRLTFKAGKDRIIIEGDSSGAAHRRYAQLVVAGGERGRIDPDAVHLTQAVIRVDYAPRTGRAPRPKDIRLTWPNTCNLGQDERDRVLREMLIKSGIDPEAIGRDAER